MVASFVLACGRAGRIAAGVLPVAVLVRLGVPAFAALVLLGVLMLVMNCWVINSGDRSARVAQMMLALQGRTSDLAPRPAVPGRVSIPATPSASAPASGGIVLSHEAVRFMRQRVKAVP